MTIQNHGTDGRKLDIDRLVEAVNSLPADGTRQATVGSLREHFPAIGWTTLRDGRITAFVNEGYRP